MKKVLKNIIVMGLITVVVLSMPTTAMGDTLSSWAVSQVQTAVDLNLVPENFHSNYTKATTRGEFCALAVKVYEEVKGEITNYGSITFKDTKDINVEKAASIGVVSGIGNDMFAPNDALTREQAAVMLDRLAQVVGKPLPNQNPIFADNTSISSWALDSVGKVQRAGIMSGTGNNQFSPKAPYTREQSIITIKRAYDVLTGAVSPNPVILNSAVSISQSLKKGMTDTEFNQAYTVAYSIASKYANLERKDQIEGVFADLADMRHSLG